MSGRKSPTIVSKYIRRRNAKLGRRAEQYEESLKRVKHKDGLHRPGSQSVRKGG